MATDPPYGVNYDPAWRQRAFPKQRTAIGNVLNDNRASWSEAFELFPGDVIYAWHAGARSGEAMNALDIAGFEVRSQIIWIKSHFVLGRGCYHQAHEPAFFAVRKNATTHWRGDRKQTTVWTVPNLNPFGGSVSAEDRRTSHSTQKPVRLFEIPILNHLRPSEAVYDPFAGSGSMLIAAEKTGRVGYAMDIDPRYVQVAVDRWQTYTGQSARLVKRV